MSIEAELRRQIAALEENCKKYQQAATLATGLLDGNKVLKQAVADLKVLEANRRIVEAVCEAVPDLKNLANPPD
jgi:O-succinylbenzoate synthase